MANGIILIKAGKKVWLQNKLSEIKNHSLSEWFLTNTKVPQKVFAGVFALPFARFC